jgi:malate synthase
MQIRGTISLTDTLRNKSYVLNKDVAVLLVRPRGLHLNERHLLINNEITSGSLVDFGLYVFTTQILLQMVQRLIFIYQN